MSIQDAKERLAAKESGAPTALTPRPVFLWCSAVIALMAVLVFLNEDQLVDPLQPGSGTAYALVLVFLVLIAAFLIVCYRSPALGNRLLGYAALMRRSSRVIDRDESTSIQFSRTDAVDTGLEAKRRSSRRKAARHQRRHIAAVTRDMQKERANAAQAAEPDDPPEKA